MKYVRKNNVIHDAQGKVVFTGKDKAGLPSINAAKKESCKLQIANGGLGKGSLVVQ